MENAYFNKALGNMTREMAYGGALRHMVDTGMSVKEIKNTLSYPVSYEEIQRAVYDYMLKKGILLEEEPDEKNTSGEYCEYVLEEGPFGQKSYRKVVTGQKERRELSYVPCDFGLMSKEKLDSLYAVMDIKDREYLEGIPWPRKRVYHVENDRMKNIAEIMKKAFDN